jgi:hypothetical protein
LELFGESANRKILLSLAVACIFGCLYINANAQVHENVTIELDPGYVSPDKSEKARITVDSDNFKFEGKEASEIRDFFGAIEKLSGKLSGSDLCGGIPVDGPTLTIKVSIGERAIVTTCSKGTLIS